MATPAAPETSTLTPRRETPRVLPGFGMTLGYTMVYLSLIVLIPLSAVFIRSMGLGWSHFWQVVTAPRVLASLRLSIRFHSSGWWMPWWICRSRCPRRWPVLR
jgi:ABC-type sulfate transport system permease subunit